MSALRKLRAILTLGLVSGIFWGLAFMIGRAGYELYAFGQFGLSFGNRMTWVIAFIGFLGGTIYAAGIALLPQREGRSGLSAGQSAWLGAIGGAVVALVLRFLILGGVGSAGLVGSVLYPMAVFAALGAGTGYAITGTARRGALPKGEEPRPEDRRLAS